MLASIHTGIQVPVAQVSSAKAGSSAKPRTANHLVYQANPKPKVVDKRASANPVNAPDFSKSYTLTYQSDFPDVLFIGGSDMVYWRHRILQDFPAALIDARAGRPLVNFSNVYQQLYKFKAIKPIHTIVISWGSKGDFNDGALSTLLSDAAGKTVYLVPGKNDEKSVSDFFKTFHKIYPKVYLVNFSFLANRNPEYYQSYGKDLQAFSSVGMDSWLSFLKFNMEQDYFGEASKTTSQHVPVVESGKTKNVKTGS